MSTSPGSDDFDFDAFNDLLNQEVSPAPAAGSGTSSDEEQGISHALIVAEPAQSTAPAQEQTLDPEVQLQQFNELASSLESSGVMDATGIGTLRPAFPVGYVSPVVGAHLGLNRATVNQDPVNGLPIVLQAYIGMEQRDLIEVFWCAVDTQNPVAVAFVRVTLEQVGKNINTNIPPGRALPGFNQWYIRVTRALSDNQKESAKMTVFYKNTLPGGPDLRPNEAWHSELLKPEIQSPLTDVAPGDFIAVKISPYPYMRVRDRIVLSVGGQEVTYVVQEAEVDQEVTILVPGTTILAIKDQETATVVWQVYDEVRNQSEKWSAVATVELEVGPDLLGAPSVQVNGRKVEEIRLDDLGSRDVEVVVRTVSPLFKRGDVVKVQWTGTSAEGQTIVLSPAPQTITDPNEDYRFSIANSEVVRIAGGRALVSYNVQRAGSTDKRSRKVTVGIAGRVQKLPAPSVVQAPTLVLPISAASADVVLSWTGMTLGDQVKLVWEGRKADGSVYATSFTREVSSNEAAASRKVINVPREHFASLDGGNLQLRYEMQPAVSLPTPLKSETLFLLVGTQQNKLMAPVVQGAVGGALDPDRQTADVLVLTSYAAQAGDQVMLLWQGSSAQASFSDTKLVREGAPSFSVPLAVVKAGRNQIVNVSYTVRDKDGVVQASEVIALVIVPEVPTVLGAPVSLQAVGGSLDPAQVPVNPGATFYVDYQGMRPGDAVVLMFSGKSTYSSERQTVSVIGRLTFNVPRSVVVSEMGSSVRVTYVLQRPGSSQSSPSLNLQINAALSINTKPMYLNGLAIKANWARTGLDSIRNTQVRRPSGGVAPYSYSSNRPDIASVSNGKVTGNKEGLVTITVTDRSGSSVSYQAMVSNTWQVHVNYGRLNHNQAVAWMRSIGGTPLGLESMDDIQRVYGYQRIPLTAHTWMCTNSGCNPGMFAFLQGGSKEWMCSGPDNRDIIHAICLTPI